MNILKEETGALTATLKVKLTPEDYSPGVEKALKGRGVPAIHYVSPSIWAWRGKRIHKIGESVSRILALFPFEPALYEKEGIPVSYVGHPLADMLPIEDGRVKAREMLDLSVQHPVFALCEVQPAQHTPHALAQFLRHRQGDGFGQAER